jgi:hypothetical protein
MTAHLWGMCNLKFYIFFFIVWRFFIVWHQVNISSVVYKKN